MRAFEIQFYPYKEHPEIIEEFFGYRFKKSVDSLFPLFDYISEPILEVGFFKERFFLIQKGNLFGVIQQNGSIFIPPKYVQVIPTEGERFFLMNTDFKWGFKGIIPESHERIYDNIIESPCIYDEIGEYSEGFYVVKSKEKFGYAPIIKDNICIYPQFEDAKPFHEGFAAVKMNGKWGFIDSIQSIVIPLEYENVGSFVDGKVEVWKDNRQYQIDFMGNAIKELHIPSECEYRRIGGFKEGLCAVEKDGHIGFIDTNENLIIPFEYNKPGYLDDTPCFSEGFACVRKGHFWGYIDKHNHVVFPFVFDHNRPIRNGRAFVYDGNRVDFNYKLLTCKHFFDFLNGNKVPFRLERKPPMPKADYDSGWSRRDLQDAYEAAYEI